MRRWVATAVALTAACAVVPGVPASAGPIRAPAGSAPVSQLTAASDTYDVTLVTGDRVHVTELGDGRRTATITAAPRADGSIPAFQTLETGGRLSVVPDDVASLVPRRLDPQLFDVTALAEQGYADPASGTLPLILTYTEPASLAAAPAVPATEPTRRLESIGGTGATMDKKQAAQLGAALAELARTGGGSGDRRLAGPLAGVEKIWLDRRVEAVLDRSVPQISAPAAWAAGYDGAGTTVAVLDTGFDSRHPDLAGKIADERDFTGEDSVRDTQGHGTHVASTIAGSGAASGGRLKGVAPGAKLLNGRVLNGDGEGAVSWIIDGMEWAATDKQADIVNMSLGSPEAGGPLTEAVDSLTERHGTLFVIAAGNLGCDGCVGSPGDAPAALTVGAVDAEDRLADFSSRGPIGPDGAVKPDVTAPGVGIVAARAEGTSLGEPVDASHTRLSGTSMATPHVAGAAALLRQARPGIRAGELKALLMGSARHQEGNSVDEQGSGRVDVAAALADPVVASLGSVNFGTVESPATGAAPVTRKVSYRNVSGAPVPLNLRSTGAFTVSPATLTVPAGGSAEAQVSLDAAKVPEKRLREELVATTAQGRNVRTLLTADVREARVELRVSGIARDGRPARGGFTVLNLDDGTLAGRLLPGDSAAPCTDERYGSGTCLRVRPGSYSVLGHIFTAPSWQDSTESGQVLNESLVGDPEMTITKDTEVVLDARKAVEVRVETPDHRTKRNTGAAEHLLWYRAPAEGEGALRGGTLIRPGAQLEERLFIQPTRRVTKGVFSVATRWRLDAPAITMRALGITLNPEYYDPVWFSDLSPEFPRLDGPALLQLADAGQGRPEDLKGRDLRGKLALIRRTDGIPVAKQSNDAAAAGARMVAIYNDRPGVDTAPGGSGVKLSVPTVRLSQEEGRKLLSRLRHLPVPVLAEGVVASPYQYELFLREKGRVPEKLHYVVRAKSLAREETDFYSQLADDVTVNEARWAFEPWDATSLTTNRPVHRTPRTQVTYVTPDPEVRWNSAAGAPELPYNHMWEHAPTPRVELSAPDIRPYREGERSHRTWFRQPLVPGVNPHSPLRRQGDTLRISMQGFVDAGGNFGSAYTSDFEQGLRTDFRLYRGTTLIGQMTGLPSARATLPPEKSDYRIEYEIENRATWAKLSTRTKTAWTFASEHTADGATGVIPLLLAGYDVPVDLKNRGAPASLGLTLRHQPGAPTSAIKDVSLEVSYDDGATWRAVRRLTPTGGGSYKALLERPAPGAGAVSLRLRASDAQGGGITQEVIRAYALPGR
ncbi:S8 family peptidase [Streptosporangium roseum]|uniref:S8 family peptidase n=1 Tax=Streptosporangium roseum TaxID=2001 RepID=UPI0033176FFC